jgi:hypothetical protein
MDRRQSRIIKKRVGAMLARYSLEMLASGGSAVDSELGRDFLG